MNLNKSWEMIIFVSILNTFNVSNNFRAGEYLFQHFYFSIHELSLASNRRSERLDDCLVRVVLNWKATEPLVSMKKPWGAANYLSCCVFTRKL